MTPNGPSDLHERVNYVFENESSIQDSDGDIALDAIMKGTANDFVYCKNTGGQYSLHSLK